MKTIVLEIDESYGEVLAISAVGRNGRGLNVSTGAYAIKDKDRLTIRNDGKITHSQKD